MDDSLLRLDFKPADLGDTPDEFERRLEALIEAAEARTDATPDQQEAGVRYLLIRAQIGQLLRQVEQTSVAGGVVAVTQGIAVRLAGLRREQRLQLALSGLPNPAGTVSMAAVSYPVRARF